MQKKIKDLKGIGGPKLKDAPQKATFAKILFGKKKK